MVLGYFWCGFAVIFISKYGIAVFKVQAVCGNFKFYVVVIGEKLLSRGDKFRCLVKRGEKTLVKFRETVW